MTARPTTEAAYRDWGLPPRELDAVERVEQGSAVSGERIVRADVCVIGTGAGGAPVAKELAEGGRDVVMLEEGPHWRASDLTARPRDMTAMLYRDAGQVTTLGNPPILLPLGSGIGGTTFVNSGTCFRTPEPVLAHWRRDYGLEQLASSELDPYFRRVERELNVSQVPPDLAGNNALVVKRGADALGWSNDFIYRNARGCVGSGVCAFGCPTSAKQHTGITYVPKAWHAGATTWTGAHAERVLLDERRAATGVQASTSGGGTLTVLAPTVIVACGTIHTPLLLGRSGLAGESGQLGQNLAIHPATAVRALFDEEIDMARGVPQSLYIDEFAEDGIMFEGAAGPPDYLALSFPFSRERHRDLMLRYHNLSQFGVMVSDRSRGSVRERAGHASIRYRLVPEDVAAFKRGIELLTELYWAAGARAVYQPVAGVPELRDGDLGPLPGRRVEGRDLTLMAFHPLGTARADARASHGVVDGDLRVHGTRGVYVSDGSAVPSSLGVNPQMTIMALSTRLAYALLGKPAPDDEPEPESIARPRATAHA